MVPGNWSKRSMDIAGSFFVRQPWGRGPLNPWMVCVFVNPTLVVYSSSVPLSCLAAQLGGHPPSSSDQASSVDAIRVHAPLNSHRVLRTPWMQCGEIHV